MTLLAVAAAGLGRRYPDTGPPSALYLATHPDSGTGDLGDLLRRVGKLVLSVPDEHVSTTVDVRPWLEQKWAAILAHRSQVERERAPPGDLVPDAGRGSSPRHRHRVLHPHQPVPIPRHDAARELTAPRRRRCTGPPTSSRRTPPA